MNANSKATCPQTRSGLTATSTGLSGTESVSSVILAVQALLFLLLLWKLPSVDNYDIVIANTLRLPFLCLMGMTGLYMLRANAVGGLKMFLAVCLFEPAISLEQWMPVWLINTYIMAGAVVLFAKARPIKPTIEIYLCAAVGLIMIVNDVGSSGDRSQLMTWGFYLVAGGVFCSFCRNLKLVSNEIRGIAFVCGMSTVLMVFLSIASTHHNGRLPLSVDELILTPFRLGQVDLESYNTFGYFCAVGVMNWLVYMSTGGRKWLGLAGAAICAAGLMASKTLTVIIIIFLISPLFILYSTANLRAWRLTGLGIWVATLMAVVSVGISDFDLLAIRSRDTDSGSGRLVIWEGALALLTSKPMGVNWSEYAAGTQVEQSYVDLRGVIYQPIISPHNIILTSFLFSGVLGGALFVWLLGLWVNRIIWSFLKNKFNSAPSCVALLTLLCHMAMDFWYFYFFFGIMWLYFDLESDAEGRQATT